MRIFLENTACSVDWHGDAAVVEAEMGLAIASVPVRCAVVHLREGL